MLAKKVYENIEFKRGLKPRKVLNIGHEAIYNSPFIAEMIEDGYYFAVRHFGSYPGDEDLGHLIKIEKPILLEFTPLIAKSHLNNKLLRNLYIEGPHEKYLDEYFQSEEPLFLIERLEPIERPKAFEYEIKSWKYAGKRLWKEFLEKEFGVKENLDFQRGIKPKSALGLGWEDYFKNFHKTYFSTPSPHGERTVLRIEFNDRLARLEPTTIPMKWEYMPLGGGGRYLTDNKAYELGHGLVLVTNNHFTSGTIVQDGEIIAALGGTAAIGNKGIEILMKKAEALEEPMMED